MVHFPWETELRGKCLPANLEQVTATENGEVLQRTEWHRGGGDLS